MFDVILILFVTSAMVGGPVVLVYHFHTKKTFLNDKKLLLAGIIGLQLLVVFVSEVAVLNYTKQFLYHADAIIAALVIVVGYLSAGLVVFVGQRCRVWFRHSRKLLRLE